MLYGPSMTKGCTVLSGGIKKLRVSLRLTFHPDKTPWQLPEVPHGTPPMAEYADAFEKLSDALSYEGNGATMLPVESNALLTTSLDLFVSRLLRWTDPPVIDEHCLLHEWWIKHARPTFTDRRREVQQLAADAREPEGYGRTSHGTGG